MSNLFQAVLAAIGFNDGANRGFWRIQPRDRYGRWIEMGANVLAVLKSLRGTKTGITGKYVGPSGKPGKARVLVKGDSDLADGVYEIDSHILETFTAKLPETYVRSKGIKMDGVDSRGNKISISDADIPSVADLVRYDITENDERLARGELTDEEREAEADGRKNSPIAELPGGFESLNRDEAKDLLRESGIDPDEFDPDLRGELTTQDSVESAVEDAIADIAYGGEAPELESLVDAAKAPSAATKKKTAIQLADGDVLKLKSTEAIVRGIRQKPGSQGQVLQVDLENENGVRKTFDVSADEGLEVLVSPDKSKFKKKSTAAPAPTPAPTPAQAPTADDVDTTAPAAPKPVSKPAAKPKTPASKPKELPTIPKGREDDGSDIAPNTTPLEQMQNVPIEQLVDQDTGRPVFGAGRKKIEDPNAIYNALLENNPQAKVDQAGNIILERGDFTDNDGKSYKYEVAVAKTHGNQYIERYKFTDSNGEAQTFYHFDYKDSFAGIYGDKNGVYVFRDHIFGKTMPGKQPPTRDTLNYFGSDKTLADRIRYFRGKKSAGSEVTLDDLNKTSFKLLTPEEVVKKYLEGRAEKYNKSGQARGTKLQSFVGSAWEAIQQDDFVTFEARMVQLLGRLPDTEESRNLLINTLRDGIKSRFNGTPLGRKVAPLANNLERKILSESFDLRDIARRPFASKDGKTIVQKGDKIRYWNNVGEWSIGTVIGLREPNKDGYDDAVYVRFGDNQIGLLRSNRMDVLGDDLDNDLNLHDKDSEPTDYKRNVQGQELRDLRGFSFDFGDEARQEDENQDLEDDQVGSTSDQDAAAPYLGNQGVSGQERAEEVAPDAEAPGNIQDFEAGDVWPDEDGDRLGTFVEAQIVTDPEDGTDAWAVVWLDDQGDEQLELVPIGTSRVPK
jgi:hypothetical protein